MSESVCEWPGCTTEAFASVDVSSDKYSPVTKVFCQYHCVIIGGKQFVVVKDELTGPFHIVGLIESVMAARELTKKKQPTLEDLRRG